MISVTIQSKCSEFISMTITHAESIGLVDLDDVLDNIQDVYRYIFARNDKEIRFVIDNNWIESRIDDDSVFVYYHSQNTMFERICSRYEICILDDGSIYLSCFELERLVSRVKII